MGTHEREEPVLALAALRPDLREARRDHAQRADAVAEGACRRIEHLLGGKADDGEIDALRDLVDRAVGPHAGDRLALEVDRIGGAVEVGVEDVAEELAADRAAAARGADHGDRGRLEERSQRVDDGGVVARLDAVSVRARRGDREAKLDLAAFGVVDELEPGVGEHRERADVRGEHRGDEAGDPVRPSAARELLEQPRADPAALLAVGDREGHLGGEGLPTVGVVAGIRV